MGGLNYKLYASKYVTQGKYSTVLLICLEVFYNVAISLAIA